ncbi:helix-hairpin-helix domain-containing protein [Streptomyces sp. NPDC048057]|uniref:helix-hairpin-helix domain-containing protein n=1 Tax=Streptomyces sp. NPDC048057 TaxID=3155628 RepID=UPI0033EEA45B
MALRSRSVTSGPGRGPTSDGRVRPRRRPVTVPARDPAQDPASGSDAGASVDTDWGSGTSPATVRVVGSGRLGAGRGAGPGRGRRVVRPPRLRVRRHAPDPAAVGHARARADAFLLGGGPRGDSARTGLTDEGPATGADFGPRPGARPAGEPGRGDALRGAGLALRDRLPVWLQLRCGLEPRSLAALTVVLVVAAAFAAYHFWLGRPETVRAPELVQQGAPLARPLESSELPAPGASSPTGAGPGGRIVVDVSGKVRRPGVLKLPAGSRVTDALTAAGGPKEGADLTGLNRARVLMDGEQVVVGVPLPPGAAPPGGAPGDAAGAAAGAAAPGTRPPGPVSLSTATVQQLDTLPGVGPVLAQHIVDYRTQHGGFRSVDELREVDGIGARRFADLKPLVRP